MKKVAGFFAILAFAVALPAQAQSLIFSENFNGGAADWRDSTYALATHHASGGVANGAYISVPVDIDTTGGGQMGGYTAARCTSGAPNPPAAGITCSSGSFTGDWWFNDGVQELRLWFRHNSAKPGGIIPQIRVAIPFNSPGGSAIFPAVPANTWTQLVIPIDPADGIWDPSWGSLNPDAVTVLRNVGRIQPGFFVDPNDPVYIENGVTFDIDNVSIWGSTSLTAEVISPETLHPRHDGRDPSPTPGVFPDDDVRAIVLGYSTAVGDPVDIDTDDIIAASVRIGRLGGDGTGTAGPAAQYNQNYDGDGLDDAEFRSLMSASIGGRDEPGGGDNCFATWTEPTSLPLRAELTTGEIIAGEDTTITTNCFQPCH